MSKVSYKKTYLDLVKDLTPINQTILISKEVVDGAENGKVCISQATGANSAAYYLSMPKENFDFEGDKIAFYNFPEFYQLLTLYSTPELDLSENKLTISEKKSKIKYVISDPETIKVGPGRIRFPEPDVSMKLTSTDLKSLKKMIGVLDAKFIKINGKGQTLTVHIFNDAHDNSNEQTFDLTTAIAEPFENKFSTEIFTLIPDNDYQFDVTRQGGIKLTYLKEGIELAFLVAEVED